MDSLNLVLSLVDIIDHEKVPAARINLKQGQPFVVNEGQDYNPFAQASPLLGSNQPQPPGNVLPKVKLAVKADRAVLLLDLDRLQDCLKEVIELDRLLKTVIIT